jgi:hypothetical protein
MSNLDCRLPIADAAMPTDAMPTADGRMPTADRILRASAVLDTSVAPVRTPEWLPASVGSFLFGVAGSLTGMVVIFVVWRLSIDLDALRTGTRGRPRRQWMQRQGRLN